MNVKCLVRLSEINKQNSKCDYFYGFRNFSVEGSSEPHILLVCCELPESTPNFSLRVNLITDGDARTLWLVIGWLTSKYDTRNSGSDENPSVRFQFLVILY